LRATTFLADATTVIHDGLQVASVTSSVPPGAVIDDVEITLRGKLASN
jgi:hypothetical protein